MRLVSVATSTRKPLSVTARISESRSSTWPRAGRTITCGSSRPVGRTIISTAGPSATASSLGAGVADTYSTRLSSASNSSYSSGRLSMADGSRKPCSTRVDLRDRSPLRMAPTWGSDWWLSSMIARKSSGK